jgi:hypothetical protein
MHRVHQPSTLEGEQAVAREGGNSKTAFSRTSTHVWDLEEFKAWIDSRKQATPSAKTSASAGLDVSRPRDGEITKICFCPGTTLRGICVF